MNNNTNIAAEGGKKVSKWIIGAIIGTMGLGGTVVIATTAKKPAPPSMGTEYEEQYNPQTGKVTKKSAIIPANHSANVAPSANTDEKLQAQQMDIEEIRQAISMMQNVQTEFFQDISTKVSTIQTNQLTAQASSGYRGEPVKIDPMTREAKLTERFSGEYQAKVSHFKGNQGNFWALSEDRVSQLTTQPTPVPMQNIAVSDGFNSPTFIYTDGMGYTINAGSRIIAVTTQEVNSDHSGYFTSRIVRPEILRGAILICQHGGQTNDRIPVNPVKIIHNDQEYQIQAQIEMNFPGMTGHINRHWGTRLTPILANAAIAGGFIAWSAQQNSDYRLNTRDAITHEVVAQTVPQVQNEIAKFAVDRPNTVTVAQGAQFSILLIQKLTIRS